MSKKLRRKLARQKEFRFKFKPDGQYYTLSELESVFSQSDDEQMDKDKTEFFMTLTREIYDECSKTITMPTWNHLIMRRISIWAQEALLVLVRAIKVHNELGYFTSKSLALGDAKNEGVFGSKVTYIYRALHKIGVLNRERVGIPFHYTFTKDIDYVISKLPTLVLLSATHYFLINTKDRSKKSKVEFIERPEPTPDLAKIVDDAVREVEANKVLYATEPISFVQITEQVIKVGKKHIKITTTIDNGTVDTVTEVY